MSNLDLESARESFWGRMFLVVQNTLDRSNHAAEELQKRISGAANNYDGQARICKNAQRYVDTGLQRNSFLEVLETKKVKMVEAKKELLSQNSEQHMHEGEPPEPLAWDLEDTVISKP